jgi:peroxiredoxin
MAACATGARAAQAPPAAPAPPVPMVSDARAAQAIQAIAAAEASSKPRKLVLSIEERRGEYVERESQAETRRRVSRGAPLKAVGTFAHDPRGWAKEFNLSTRTGGPGARMRTVEVDGTMRILIVTPQPGGEEKRGRVTRATTTSPVDAILARRVAASLEGVQWDSSTVEGDRLKLEGRRTGERHVLTLRGGELESWHLTRVIEGPSGERLPQTYWCEVALPSQGISGHLDEWIVNGAPVPGIAYRRTFVRHAQEVPQLEPAALEVRFPLGTSVLDDRFDIPVEYDQTSAGVTDEEVNQLARSLMRGRASLGEPAPPFVLRDTSDKPIQPQDYRGQTLVLFWFAADSQPSEAAARALNGLVRSYRRHPVQFLGVSVGGDAKEAAAFRRKSRWGFPVVVDPDATTLRQYGMDPAVPKVAIVDREGKLAFVQPGYNEDDIREALNRIVPAR